MVWVLVVGDVRLIFNPGITSGLHGDPTLLRRNDKRDVETLRDA